MKYEQYVGNGHSKVPRNTKDIESDLDIIRNELSQTLREIEDRVSPQAVVGDLWHRMQGTGEGASRFFHNLGATVQNNPVPVLLLGAGVVSLMASQRQGTIDEPSRLQGASERAKEQGQKMRERARETAGRVKGRGTALREGASERADAVKARATVARERARQGAQRARSTVEEQPLILIGLGLAAGALLAAAAPVTRPERERIGPRRDALLEAGREGLKEGSPSATGARSSASSVGSSGSESPQGSPSALPSPGSTEGRGDF